MRLRQGRMDADTVYSSDPQEVARRWEAAGAEWIHVVDLDGAVQGRPVNVEAVKEILEAVRCKVELGGGIRTLEVAEGWLSLGVERVVLGTAALRDPSLLREAVRRFGQRVAVAIDARDGVVMVEGWRASSSRDALEVAEELKASGVSLVIYTDIKRDGMASGPNLEAARELSALGLPFILSGGIASLEDLEQVKGLPGLVGVIVGRALYEGLIDLREAIRRFQG